MSSYRGVGAAWDGGPPGAEAEYVGQRAPAPAYEASAPPSAMPTTDPWTGVSYSQYGATPAYEYQAYGAATAGYGYNYDSSYYQRPDGSFYGKYPGATAYQPQPQPHAAYEYPIRQLEKSRSPVGSPRYGRRSSYCSKSRSHSPYTRRERDSSYEDKRGRRSRSKSSKRKKYSSSEQSSSGSRSSSHSSQNRDKKKRSFSTESSASDGSYKKKSNKKRGHAHTPPSRDKSSSCSRGRTPSMDRSVSKSPKQKKKIKNVKSHSSKDKRQKKVSTPPRKRKETAISLKRQKGTEKSTLTPPKVYKLKIRRSDSPTRKIRDNSLTPPKAYARSPSQSSKSLSGSPSPRHSKRKRSVSSGSHSRSQSFSRSRSSTPTRRSQSRSKRKNKRKSRSKSRSNRRSVSKSRSISRRRSKSRGKGKSSKSPSGSKSRSRSRSSRSRSRSGTPTDDERRGQFTVADRKRFWKLHRNRQEEREKEAKTPPKEIKPPPPGAVETTSHDDIEYGDPPEVEGPNFAELLPPPDQVMQASSSKSKALPIPIKNDGSFLEMFKKMQEVTKKEEIEKKPVIKKPMLPFIGKRRGGRVLKTGLVKKAKAIDEQTADSTPKDAWSLYMQEVKKYRETSCEEERKTRPLVK